MKDSDYNIMRSIVIDEMSWEPQGETAWFGNYKSEGIKLFDKVTDTLIWAK